MNSLTDQSQYLRPGTQVAVGPGVPPPMQPPAPGQFAGVPPYEQQFEQQAQAFRTAPPPRPQPAPNQTVNQGQRYPSLPPEVQQQIIYVADMHLRSNFDAIVASAKQQVLEQVAEVLGGQVIPAVQELRQRVEAVEASAKYEDPLSKAERRIAYLHQYRLIDEREARQALRRVSPDLFPETAQEEEKPAKRGPGRPPKGVRNGAGFEAAASASDSGFDLSQVLPDGNPS